MTKNKQKSTTSKYSFNLVKLVKFETQINYSLKAGMVIKNIPTKPINFFSEYFYKNFPIFCHLKYKKIFLNIHRHTNTFEFFLGIKISRLFIFIQFHIHFYIEFICLLFASSHSKHSMLYWVTSQTKFF
jgi:hypothetical protein